MNGGDSRALNREACASGCTPRREQRFIHIDVAHAGEECLVEQQRLDAGLARFRRA